MGEQVNRDFEINGRSILGIVLEGGGMRGLFTAGVLDILMVARPWMR